MLDLHAKLTFAPEIVDEISCFNVHHTFIHFIMPNVPIPFHSNFEGNFYFLPR